MQNLRAVRQSSSASVHTNLHKSKFAAAVVRQAASPPAHMLSPSAIRWHARTSALRVVTHALRQVFRVAGAEAKHVDSFVTHFLAQVTPAPAAKQLARAVWKAVEQSAPVPVP